MTDKQLAVRYQRGATLRTLADEEGLTIEWIRQRLLAQGVTLRPRSTPRHVTRRDRDAEMSRVKTAIRLAAGDITIAAHRLGCHRTTLYRRAPWAAEYAEKIRRRRRVHPAR